MSARATNGKAKTATPKAAAVKGRIPKKGSAASIKAAEEAKAKAEEAAAKLYEVTSDDEDIQTVAVMGRHKSRIAQHEVDDDYEEIVEFVDDADYVPAEADGEKLHQEAQTGHVKEFINNDGLGIIFSKDCGLILFHAKHVWIEGRSSGGDMGLVRQHLAPGVPVSFVHYHIVDQDSLASEEGHVRQAGAVWTPEKRRPHHLLREVMTPDHLLELKAHREVFFKHLRQRDFLAMAMVRVRGEVVGYLNSRVGVIESLHDNSIDKVEVPIKKILFHATDVYIFGNPLNLETDHLPDVLPVGLRLAVDAKRIAGAGFKGVDHQACAVFGGTWPTVPHPTLLPGGPGTCAPSYEEHSQGTFYYLQLSLADNLRRKWRDFMEVGRAGLNYVEVPNRIASMKEHEEWRSTFGPGGRRWRPSKNLPKKENEHVFKRVLPETAAEAQKRIKAERGEKGQEEEDEELKDEVKGDAPEEAEFDY